LDFTFAWADKLKNNKENNIINIFFIIQDYRILNFYSSWVN